ncbi:MAG: membrane protein insertase YidC [Candidatus Westeberhardia cardiocondylae]|nr:membrane protein insertase YidC [Candidatus Westeberhardia cardiocondylae]
MDLQKNVLIILLLVVSFILWQEWQKDNCILDFSTKKNIELQNNVMKDMNDRSNFTKNMISKFVTVKTDVLSININMLGGDIEDAYLLTYKEKLDSHKPIHFLKNSSNFVYKVQSGLIGKHGPDNIFNKTRPLYFSEKTYYMLKNCDNEIHVPLIYINYDGVVYTKMFILYRNSFLIKICYFINNINDYPLKLIFFGQIKQSISLPEYYNDVYKNSFSFNTYRGIAYSAYSNKYQKYTFDDIKHDNLRILTHDGWIAMLEKYFLTALIPHTFSENIFYTKYLSNSNQAIAGFKSSEINVLPKSTYIFESILWIGPEVQEVMKNVAPYLDLTIDYGWLWFISQPLFKLLKFIYGYVGNWGFSIIIITFILRGVMYPFTKMQYVSMAKMRILQPKLSKIRERFDDRQRQSQEIISLYKKEKINPLSSFLPLLIQMPIFLGLYYMLSSSIELRHANFIFWIHDLSDKDSYYILPILMGFTMFLIQKLFPSTSYVDPIQKKIISFFPLVFTLFFLWFPSGLVLYYTVSNFVTIIQQKFIYKELKKRGLYINR